MASSERIKRRMLRQAVEENVDIIRGLPPRSLRRSRRLAFIWLRRALTLIVPVSLGTALWFGTSVTGDIAASPPARQIARVAASALPTSVENALLQRTAPLEVDSQTQISPSVLGLTVRKIVIDAGHGGSSPGTISPDGTYEKTLTLDIAQRLAKRLREDGFDVRLTRDADVDLTLSRRAEIANESGADIFVSIHLNALRNRARRGVETYYLGPTNDPYLIEMAAHENSDSGYSVGDLRRLLDGIYAGARQDESRRLAEAVQSTLYTKLRRVSSDLDDRGVKTAPFVVLVSSEMPAILAEVSCLSHEEESKLLATAPYRDTIAEALADGIKAYATPVQMATQKGTAANVQAR